MNDSSKHDFYQRGRIYILWETKKKKKREKVKLQLWDISVNLTQPNLPA